MVCRRLGGAFGGKASRCMPPAAAAAVAAAKLRKPVRYVLTREDDMRQNQGDYSRTAAIQAGMVSEGTASESNFVMWHALPCDASVSLKAARSRASSAHCFQLRDTPFAHHPHAVAHVSVNRCMHASAGRCPVDVTYDVGFRPDGKLTALRLRGGMLAGHAKDLSGSDIEMLQAGSDMVRLCGILC